MLRILVVDDDPQVRELLCSILERAHYRVDEAEDGRQAVGRFRQNLADLLIVDIFMPVKEGIETILDLKQASPSLKVIAISGGGLSGDLEFLEHARTLGADRALTKPLNFVELLAAVRDLVGAGEESS